MSEVAKAIRTIKEGLPTEVTLVAISKTKPNEMIVEAYEDGQLDFGENKVQELTTKYEALPKDIRWHMVGHLQRNKVKYIAPFVYLIHSVDSIRLLKAIEKEAAKLERPVNVLLQMHIAQEETKYGLDTTELEDIWENVLPEMSFVQVKGLMGMATFTENEEQVTSEFNALKDQFDHLKAKELPNASMEILSMGMTNDCPLAVSCGSNMIRIGSAIFGERNYG
jgi:hypothetical protein